MITRCTAASEISLMLVSSDGTAEDVRRSIEECCQGWATPDVDAALILAGALCEQTRDELFEASCSTEDENMAMSQKDRLAVGFQESHRASQRRLPGRPFEADYHQFVYSTMWHSSLADRDAFQRTL
jgi:hypothetical protein